MKINFPNLPFFGKKETNNLATANLAAKPEVSKRYLPFAPKSIARVRQDIAAWNSALSQAQNGEEPKNFALQLLYKEICIDALLTSQIENRKQQILGTEYVLKNAAGEVDEEQTAVLKSLTAYRSLTTQMLESIYYGYSLLELELVQKDGGEKDVKVIEIPRTNIVPAVGKFFPDYAEDTFVAYRNIPEFGIWVLEFDSGDLGLLNKAVPHILFKRFAHSCWSELCEIYGIPPRVMKTNTQDGVMLRRAERMMQDMGAAAWFIIDENESFEWAQSVNTNGDVYKNLINLCNNEVSLLVSGAVMGQDTQNGSRSKDESALEMLKSLVDADAVMCEEMWNNIVIPALVKIGILKPGNRFEYQAAEDLDQLFKFTQGLLPFLQIDGEWIKQKFGVEVIGERNIGGMDANQGNDKNIGSWGTNQGNGHSGDFFV